MTAWKPETHASDRAASVQARASRSGPLRIGTPFPNYGLEHVSYIMAPPGVAFTEVRGLTAKRLARGAPPGSFWSHVPLILGPRTDLLHTFNHLPLNRPFVVSHEMEMPRNLGPRHPWQDRFSLRLLRSDRCRAILSLSEAAMRYAARRFDAAGAPELKARMTLFRGAVPGPSDAEFTPIAPHGGPVRLLFIGRDGLRKGLPATIRALELLREAGVPVHLTIVGGFTETTYVMPGARIDMAPLRDRLPDLPVTHHEALPNDAVRALMRGHDALLFPTLDESLGWVTIEAALQGLPTIASAIFAQPELIEDGRTGWLLPVETDADGRWIHTGRPDAETPWRALSERFAAGIAEIVTRIAADPDLASRLGAAARAKLAPLYLPEAAGIRLAGIYEAALG